jgi:hypothetical protein
MANIASINLATNRAITEKFKHNITTEKSISQDIYHVIYILSKHKTIDRKLE